MCAAFARRLSPATAAFLLFLAGIGCINWMPAPFGRSGFLLFGFAAGFLLSASSAPLPSHQRIPMLAISLLALRASLDAIGSPLFPVLQTLGILGAIAALSRWPGTGNGLLQPLAFFGDRSYSFYLVHGVALKVFFDFILPRSASVQVESLFTAVFVTALGCAVMLYRLVERPAYALRMPALPVIFLEPVERGAARAK
jgi:peptidoglycan/LPS O-acetylase OafA/YrhL